MLSLETSPETVGDIHYPWVIISLSHTLFGISSEMVTSMEILPPVTEIPQSPAYMRGMVKSRGKMLPLIDTRTKLGYKSLREELDELSQSFDHFKKEHHQILDELEHRLKSSEPISDTVSKEHCAFGKWYKTFKTDNFAIQHLLKQFEKPHTEIHDCPIHVARLVDEDKNEEAWNHYQHIRSTSLNEISRLFNKSATTVQQDIREIMIVVEINSVEIGMTVDSVTSVEYLNEGSIQEIPAGHINEDAFASQIGKRQSVDQNVIILDFNKIDVHNLQRLVKH